VSALRVDDDGLVLRSSRRYPAAHDCRFRVNGLHVFRRSALRGVLPWDDGRGADSTPVQTGADPQAGRWSIQPYLASAPAGVGTHRKQYVLRRARRGSRWQADTETAAALAGYLSATPTARAALDHLDRIAAVVAAALRLGGAPQIAGTLTAGPGAVLARVQQHLDTDYRRFQGRPVASEPWPSVDDVMSWLETGPPTAAPPTTLSPDEMRTLVAPFVDVEPWPFSQLLDVPADDTAPADDTGPSEDGPPSAE
jgi:hypothetical protein